MTDRLRVGWDKLRTSLWPIPVAMLVAAMLLLHLTLALDKALGDKAAGIWWLHSGSGEDAVNLLSTLLGALITMASVMFSITMVVLSLAANQFGSRLVRTYTSDLRIQLALGMFFMTIAYCLVLLLSVQKDMPLAQVPDIGVSLAVLLAMGCILTLLLFLHTIGRSMVADDVIRRVSAELEEGVARLPEITEEAGKELETRTAPERRPDGAMLRSRQEGYVQAINYDDLAKIAEEREIVVRVNCSAGAFMCRDGWLAAVEPAESLTDEADKAIQSAFKIGDRRTPTQDLEFPIRQLADIALRALSPGINDPNTAIVVVDRLRGALSRLMGKRIPSTSRCDPSGELRVLGHDSGYAGIFDEAFNQIRQAAAPQPSVIIHLLGAIERMAEHVRVPEQRDPLLAHVALIANAGLRETEEESDKAEIARKRAGAERKLNQALDVRTNLLLRPPLGAAGPVPASRPAAS
jgi:uncharacterized membrane protein